jgi:tryptophanyl-tRNA synthetase
MRRSDPGNPDVCNVFTLHKVFSTPEEVAAIDIECRRAGIGCVQCKQQFARNLNAHLEPFRARRAELDCEPQRVWDVLRDGQARAQAIARETMKDVRAAIGLPS